MLFQGSLLGYSYHVSWAKKIWTDFIPPSRSLFIWRLIHGKLSSDDKLKAKVFCLASYCRLCGNSEEN